MENDNDYEVALKSYGAAASAADKEALRSRLVLYINALLLNDFGRLVQLLYRVDVDEAELKGLLQQSPETDAAELITHLVLRREAEKLAARAAFKNDSSIPEDEKW